MPSPAVGECDGGDIPVRNKQAMNQIGESTLREKMDTPVLDASSSPQATRSGQHAKMQKKPRVTAQVLPVGCIAPARVGLGSR